MRHNRLRINPENGAKLGLEMKRLSSVEALESVREEIRASRDPDATQITVCGGTGCRANGSLELAQALAATLAERGLDGKVQLKLSGCHGFCQQGPVVVIDPQGVFYGKVGCDDLEMDVREIVEKTVMKEELVERLLYRDPESGESIAQYDEIPFYARQTRIALRNNGKIDPNSLEDFIAADGYAALAKAILTDPEDVTDWIVRSGLRGRGGGGFPTGRKWGFCRNAADRSRRYIICNADEGDPGAFMDRSIMEGDPHSVLEGMAIGAYAMSAGICPAEGYIYIRAEYPLAVENVVQAIEHAEEAGLLGEKILGTDFSFHIKIKEGAGAFVCGEETALIASIQGKRGMPRTRPPFPANRGLFDKPSNINNVETWANVPRIVNGGPEWYAKIGTPTSSGTKVFSLVGKVKNSGLVEVPMGMSLREIVFDIGGGIPGDKRIKAVQTGGPSGGCIPAKLLDLPVDYEKLAEAGAIMGSGGLVVMDEDTCMVDIARYFVAFTQDESCGKCVPCRLGTKQMLQILNDIAAGKGRPEDLDLLEEIAQAVKLGSLCGLGQTAPNPVLTTLRYFRDEYESHIKRQHCPAVVCRGLVSAPCKHTCPAGIDVPRYIRCIATGRHLDAFNVIREKIPFPSVCGYVCFHPCELKCRRSELDDPIAIRALKRFVADYSRSRPPDGTSGSAAERLAPTAKPTGKRVAVIGSGPAGLSAAYYLGRLGHEVTVFERNAEAGGTLRSGIPSFRLPREVIDAEIKEIEQAAHIRIRTGTSVASLDKLLKGYDAVLLAHGAQKGLTMGIDGEDAPGVFDCLTFLKRANAGEAVDLGNRVVVIGGGSSATDVARTARRLGAENVVIIYRRTRNEMPAGDEEVEESLEEGVKIEFLTAPVRIREQDGHLSIECVSMKQGAVDESGRRRPVPIDGSEFNVEADSVIMAVGQSPEDMSDLACEVDRRGRIKVGEDSLQTSRLGVFAAGDVVTGPSSVIKAIAAGRRAAQSIDQYLGGAGDIDETFAPVEGPVVGEMLEDTTARPRIEIPKRPAMERLADGGQVELTYPEAAAVAEALRCLRCDLEEIEE